MTRQRPTIWVFPIEPFEERYTAQWYKWFSATGPFGKLIEPDSTVTMIDAETYETINEGEFLDAVGTHVYKARQLAVFADAVGKGYVKDGDTVLFLDAWNPAVLNVAYMRDALGLNLKMVGCVHAGTWDPHDFLSRKKMGRWAKPAERGMLRALNSICVATEFHAQMIRSYFGEALPVRVTGFPLYDEEFIDNARDWKARKRLVVFPHRLAPEKQPEVFAQLEHAYRRTYPDDDDVQFVRSRDVCNTKAAYYDLLGRARVVFSSALQETWGIAMLEGALLGAYPVSPASLSYPEVHGALNSYGELPHAVALVRAGLDATEAHQHARRRLWRDTAMEMIGGVCDRRNDL